VKVHVTTVQFVLAYPRKVTRLAATCTCTDGCRTRTPPLPDS
jgi:hypothetical protein